MPADEYEAKKPFSRSAAAERRRLVRSAARRTELLIDSFDLLSVSLPAPRRKVFKNGLLALLAVLQKAEGI